MPSTALVSLCTSQLLHSVHTCLQQSLHMPLTVAPHAFNSPGQPLHLTTPSTQSPHLPSTIPARAFDNPLLAFSSPFFCLQQSLLLPLTVSLLAFSCPPIRPSAVPPFAFNSCLQRVPSTVPQLAFSSPPHLSSASLHLHSTAPVHAFNSPCACLQ